MTGASRAAPGVDALHPSRRPRIAVWKFASCDGCQLSLLDCEEELLAVADAVELAYFLEAGAEDESGPFDLSIVEGSITTPQDSARIRRIRERSRKLVTIGACATAGGIQALRNGARVAEWISVVYAHPEYVSTLETSTPIADHVEVDFELRGCPVDKRQLVELIAAFAAGRRPNIRSDSVCMECKRAGTVCVMVTGTPCLGPITHAGCGALCPRYRRGCYGCFGPAQAPNVPALTRWSREALGQPREEQVRALRTFNAWAEPFRGHAAALSEPAPPEEADERS